MHLWFWGSRDTCPVEPPRADPECGELCLASRASADIRGWTGVLPLTGHGRARSQHEACVTCVACPVSLFMKTVGRDALHILWVKVRSREVWTWELKARECQENVEWAEILTEPTCTQASPLPRASPVSRGGGSLDPCCGPAAGPWEGGGDGQASGQCQHRQAVCRGLLFPTIRPMIIVSLPLSPLGE